MKFYTELCLVFLSISVLCIGSLWIINNPNSIKTLFKFTSQQAKYSSNNINISNSYATPSEYKKLYLEHNYLIKFIPFKYYSKRPINDFQICKQTISFPHMTDCKHILQFSPFIQSAFDITHYRDINHFSSVISCNEKTVQNQEFWTKSKQ